MIATLFSLLTFPPHQPPALDSLLFTAEGTYSIVFWIVGEPESQILIRPDESFHAASTMKTAVMIELFRQGNLADSVLVKNEFKSIVDGSPFSLSIDRDGGDALYSKLGTRIPMIDVIHDMITRSGNLATNLLIEKAGPTNVNATMRRLGANSINVLRGVEDMKAFDAGLSNTTTALDLAIIFDHLAKGTAVSPQADSLMLDILKQQHYRDVIPALLPSDLEIAHKTGAINRVVHDSGIVFLPDGRRYVLVILSKNLPSNEYGTDIAAKISKIIYDHASR